MVKEDGMGTTQPHFNDDDHDATLVAMLQQEASTYFLNWDNSSSSSMSHCTVAALNQAMTTLEEIFDLCRLQHHETLVIAASYLHRYCLLNNNNNNSKDCNLPLIALVSFYMAVKVHEPAAIPLRSLADLYQRFFSNNNSNAQGGGASTISVHQLEQVELEICRVLQWHLHPPTPMGFVSRVVDAAGRSDQQQQQQREFVMDRVQMCLETAFRANPVVFVRHFKASTLGMAALLLTRTKELLLLSDDITELRRAVTFLGECSSNSGSPTTTTTTPEESTPPTKTSNKRCGLSLPTVSPSSSPSYLLSDRPRKRSRHNCKHNKHDSMISSSSSSSSLLWNRSPRSALSVAEDTT